MARTVLFSVLVFVISACASWGSKDAEKAELLLRMGNSQFENGNYPAALADLLKAEEMDPSNPVIHNNLGLTYFMRQRFELAEKHLRKALKINSSYTEARNNLSRVLIEVGRNKEAEKEIKTVLNDLTYPQVDKAYINLGLAQFNQRHFSEAKDSFQQAMHTSKDNCVANAYYGRSLFEMKDYENAAPALDTAIGFCQRAVYDEPHYFSALTYYRLGQKDKSVTRFAEIIKLYPEGKYRGKSRAMLDLIRKAN